MAKLNAAFSKYQSILKQVRKNYPRMPFPQAQKEAAKLFHGNVVGKVTGVKKKKKAPAAKRKRVTIAKVVAGPRKKRAAPKARTVKKRVGAIGKIERAETLVREINRLEEKRAKATVKELRDIIQLEINAKHDRLDGMRKRRRSA